MIHELTAKECAELLLGAKDPTVVMHVRPDGDTVGSAVALIKVFEALGKNAGYICNDEIPERLSFLTKGIEKRTKPSGDVVCIDIASVSQIGDIYESFEKVLFTVDHHASNTPFSPHYTVSKASSAAEALMDVIELLEHEGHVKLNKEIADALYAAISSDTGRFCYSSTTPKTHRRAARLLELGADAAAINHLLFNTKSLAALKAEAMAALGVRLFDGGSVAGLAITKEDIEEIGARHEDFDTAIDIVRSVRGVEIALVVKETPDGKIKASLRSTNENVARIAEAFGGGGHILAAGCYVDAKSTDEALDLLISEMKKQRTDK